jgi:hypothetical protein
VIDALKRKWMHSTWVAKIDVEITTEWQEERQRFSRIFAPSKKQTLQLKNMK